MKERKTTVELALLIIILSNIFCFEDRMKSTHLTKIIISNFLLKNPTI